MSMNRAAEDDDVAEPPSSACECSLAGWRCQHIEVEQPKVDPPDCGHGLSL